MKKSNPIQTFFDSTTAHGFGRVFKSSSIFHRVFWLTILSMALCGTSYILYGVIDGFLESPTATSITVERVPNMTFPQIQICNRFSLNQSYLRQHNISQELALYTQHIFSWALSDFNVRYPQEREQALEAEYNALTKRFPNEDIREFFFSAGIYSRMMCSYM